MIRSDRWGLAPTQEQYAHLLRTVEEYRRFVRELVGIIYVHWPAVAREKHPDMAVEKLVHPTRFRPEVRHAVFAARWHKFPSYYRRVAIREAIGIVSSFVTRYNTWQGGTRRRRDAKPPRLTRDCAVWPSLYRGQCIKYEDGAAQIKIHNGSDWVWITVPIKGKPKAGRHLRESAKDLCPQLIVRRGKTHLSMPFECSSELPKKKEIQKVVGVDLGINVVAVASVIDSSGTVTRREFYSHAADMDSRDRRLARIPGKARLTMGKTGKLSHGFCKGWYRKAANINENIAHQVSRNLVDMALKEDARAIVFERMKGWRPRGGRKRSSLRQRFHGWMHRRIVKLTQEKAEEAGILMGLVNPRGTSKYAYDGSGKVKRDRENATQATFASGKRYHSDLSASYNIGARYWEAGLRNHFEPRKGAKSVSGKRSRSEPRMPVTLSSLWSGGRVKPLFDPLPADE